MSREPKKSQPSRRGFLRSFLMNLPPKSEADRDEERKRSQRASVLALKYAKNEAQLTRIGVESPVNVDEFVFRVKICGHNSESVFCKLTLQVDTSSDMVGTIEPESGTQKESSAS